MNFADITIGPSIINPGSAWSDAERLFQDGDIENARLKIHEAVDQVAEQINPLIRAEIPQLPKRKVGKYIYLPVLDPRVQLQGRIEIATEASKRGLKVLIGDQNEMMDYKTTDVPPGVFLFTRCDFNAVQLMWQAVKGGHLIYLIPEEYQYLTPEQCEIAFDSAALKLADKVDRDGVSYVGLGQSYFRPENGYFFREKIHNSLAGFAKPITDDVKSFLKQVIDVELSTPQRKDVMGLSFSVVSSASMLIMFNHYPICDRFSLEESIKGRTEKCNVPPADGWGDVTKPTGKQISSHLWSYEP